jgi:putative transposase
VKKPYHIVSREAETAAASMEEFAKANGQILLPLVELITQARLAVDEVIDSIGRQTIETILNLSAEQIAGSRTPGKSSGDIRWHGSQKGRVSLADRQIKVQRPRLRHKQAGEVTVPTYESLQENSATAQRMMGTVVLVNSDEVDKFGFVAHRSFSVLTHFQGHSRIPSDSCREFSAARVCGPQ